MKSYIKLLTLGAILAGTSACTDLDVPVNGYYTEFPNSPEALEGKLQGCYSSFQSVLCRDYKEMVLLTSDEFFPISFDGDYRDLRYAAPYLHQIHPDQWFLESTYNAMSGGIVYCNNVILELGGENGTDPIVAPVRAARAFYHFILMDCFGDVPVLAKNTGEGEAVERKPRAEVAKFIESELLDIIPVLTENIDGNTYGKPNKWMAEALLVKLYLNWGVYTNDITTVDNNTANEKLNDCVKWCDELIKSGKFELGDSYRKKFFPDNGVQIKDFIYSTAYNVDNGHDWDRYFQFRQNKGGYNSYWGFELTQSCGGNIKVNPYMVDLLQALPGDERAKTVIGGPIYEFDPSNYELTSTPFIYNGQQVVFTKDITLKYADTELNVGKDINGWCQGYECVKYPINNTYNTHSRRQTNDIPIFRYADILLTKAECILRGATATEGDTPASLMNKVRDCASAPHVNGTPSLQDLLDERGREFFAELWRRNDLIRFGQFEKERLYVKDINPTSLTNKNLRLYPIGTAILNNNTNWSQNKGY